MHTYTVKLRRYKKGAYGTTMYRFPIQMRAFCFAEGYYRCLRDIGITDIYVSVHNEKGEKLLEIK